jgi:colanic acid biosynthesis glycosyl transferase WcaI
VPRRKLDVFKSWQVSAFVSACPEDGRKKGQVVKKRLLLVTQLFDPEPTFKSLLFARALSERGFEVEVVTGFPNYPGGKLYPGYRIRPMTKEVVEGINITRLALYPSHDKSAVKRILTYGTFFLSSLIYLLFLAKRADVVYVYHPPLTVGLAAALARFFRRTPTVIDVQDLWPDTLLATGMIRNTKALRFIGVLADWLYRQMNHIVVLSPGFRKLLINRGVPDQKLSVIYNWADEASVIQTSKPVPELMSKPGKFRVLFAGNMGPAQGLDAVIDAARIVGKTNDRVEFCFLGGGIDLDRIKARVENEKCKNIVFLPRVPMAEVGAFLAAADCLLVHLTADPLFEITIPSKTQAYMAAGKPILMAVKGDAADLIIQSGGGIVAEPENAESLAAAVLAMAGKSMASLREMGQAASTFYFEKLSLKHGADAFADTLNKVAR